MQINYLFLLFFWVCSLPISFLLFMLLYKLYNSEKYKRYRRIDNIRKHKEDESILKYEKFKYNIKLYSRDCKYVKPSIFNTQRRYCKKYSVVTACKPFECLYIINKVKSVVS